MKHTVNEVIDAIRESIREKAEYVEGMLSGIEDNEVVSFIRTETESQIDIEVITTWFWLSISKDKKFGLVRKDYCSTYAMEKILKKVKEAQQDESTTA